MSEMWLPIPHNPEYLISDMGRISRGGKLLKPCLSSRGRYFQIHIGLKARFLIHRLVLQTFIGDPKPGFECNHKDGNKLNNALSNLEWVTRRGNVHHAFSLGLRSTPTCQLRGEQSPSARLNETQVLEIRSSKSNFAVLSRKYNVSKSAIERVVRRKTWKHIP
jgi:hypothetical protein